MFSKGSKFYSVFRFKCPHCHEGEFFVDRNPYNLSKVGNVLEECSVCHRRFSPEPGFYFGAMYVSYALTVAMFVTAYVATVVLYPQASTGLTVGIVLAALVVTTPWLYALSKSMYAAIFISYKGVAETEQERAYKARRSEGVKA
jgi:hypothetical protein